MTGSIVPITGQVVAIIPRSGGFRQLTIETDRPLVPRSKAQRDRELYPWFAQAVWEQMVLDRGGADRVLGARILYTNAFVAFEDDVTQAKEQGGRVADVPRYPIHTGGPSSLGRLLTL